MTLLPGALIHAVDWVVDHKARTIMATVRLRFFMKQKSWWPFQKELSPEWLQLLKDGIEKRWNGHHYKCYAFIVKLDVRLVTSRAEVEDNALDVEILDDIHLRSHVALNYAHQPPDGGPLSDSPNALLLPTRGGPGGMRDSQWKWMGSIDTWCHEMGHVLGLNDGYIDQVFDQDGHEKLVRGHTADMMYDFPLPVSPQMITRVVRRNISPEDVAMIKCPITFDAGPSSLNLFLASLNDMHLHAYCCDYEPPTDDSSKKVPLSFTGTFFYGGQLMTKPMKDVGGMVAAVGLMSPLTAPLLPAGIQLTQLPTDPSGTLSIPVSFTLSLPGEVIISVSKDLTLEGLGYWDGDLPYFFGSLSLNALDTGSWFPGPPMYAFFSHGAKECAQ